MQKTGRLTAWDAGATSTASLSSGNGSVQVTADSTAYGRMVGLTHNESSPSYTDISYAIELQSDGSLYIYEAGVYRAYVGTYAVGDVLKVAVESGVVHYYRNSTLLYTSSVAPSYPLLMDASIRDPGGQLVKAVSCGDAPPTSTPTSTATASPTGTTPASTATPTATPTGTTCGIPQTQTPPQTPIATQTGDLLPDLGMAQLRDIQLDRSTMPGCLLLRFSTIIVNVGAGPFEVQGQRPDTATASLTTTQRIYNGGTSSTLRKTGSTASAWDAGATSSTALASGNGSAQVTADFTNYGRMVGLTHNESSPSYTDISYAIELQSDGSLYIYEAGVYRAYVGTYAVGDVLKVAVESGVVHYYRNSTLLYTSSVAPSYPLLMDASIRDYQGELANAVFCTPSCAPVTWTNLVNTSARGYRDVPSTATMYFAGDGHHHWHVKDLEYYELDQLNNGVPGAKVGVGAKHGFCFTDNVQYRLTLPGAPQTPTYLGCGIASDLQVLVGLSVGWGDLYSYALVDQWIDITGLNPGTYRLYATANASHQFLESNYADNSTYADIQLNADGTLTVLGYGPGA